jgi:predicted PurR-regulated permease PerM
MPQNRRSDILFAFGVAIALALAFYIRNVLLLIYVSAMFAVVIGPGIEWLQKLHFGKWHPGRGMATLLLLGGIIALAVLFLIFALPPIFYDIQSFTADLPNKVQRLQSRMSDIPGLDRLNPSMLTDHIASALGGVVGIFKGIAGGLLGFFSFLVLLAYFVIDGDRAFKWGLSLFTQEHRSKLRETLLKADRRVSKWLVGQLMLMLILGVLSGITYRALGVKYSYALAVFTGVANIVPIVGPVISVGLAAIVAAFDSWTKAAGVLIFYAVYQQLENAFLTPKIMKSTVDLPGLAVIIALAIGGGLAGILGALVAVPTAALVSVIVDEYVVDHEA